MYLISFSIFAALFVIHDAEESPACKGSGSLKTYNYSATNWLDACHYYCNEDQKYYHWTELTWDEMQDISVDISRASDAALCDDVTDLIYSNTTNCYLLPQCACTNTSSREYNINVDNLFTQQCVSCNCKSSQYHPDPIYDCSILFTNVNPYHWDDVQCPVEQYCEDGDYSMRPGTGWWKKDGDQCDTYCYCTFEGEIYCEDGYEAISDSKNIDFVAAFRNDCQNSLGTCLDESSLWVEGSCKQCPQCGCGEHAFNEYWTEEVENTFEDLYNYAGYSALSYSSLDKRDFNCYNCSCYNYTARDADNAMKGYYDAVRCQSVAKYSDGQGECPPDTSSITTCYESNDLIFDESNADEVECGSTYEGTHCGWQYDVDKEDGDEYGHSCANTLMCDAFDIEDGECIYYTATFDLSEDLENCGISTSFSSVNSTSYLSCCEGDLCNNYDIDITQCTYSEAASDFWTQFYSCNYKTQFEIANCEDVENTNCKQLISFGEEYYGCFCSAYASIYDKLNTANKAYAKGTAKHFFKGMNHWLEAFDCKTKEFGCNYEKGSVTKDDSQRISTFFGNLAVVFTAILSLSYS